MNLQVINMEGMTFSRRVDLQKKAVMDFEFKDHGGVQTVTKYEILDVCILRAS
jgi:hypothetical protein